MKQHANVTQLTRKLIFNSEIWKLHSPLFGAFVALMLAIGSSGLTGCGKTGFGGTPSDSNVSDAVKRYFEKSNVSLTGLKSIELPKPPDFAGLFDCDDKVTISDVRVVKRGKSFHDGSGENSVEGFPVRVHVNGIRIVGYSKWVGLKIVNVKSVNLPFEGEADFVIIFQQPDKTQVDEKPGVWVAQPN